MLKTSDLHMPQFFKGASAWAALALVVMGTLVGISTFLVLTGLTPLKPSESIVSWLLFANTVLEF
jgi:hypothetical protein